MISSELGKVLFRVQGYSQQQAAENPITKKTSSYRALSLVVYQA